MSKTVVLNASPRNNWNTAHLLREAMEGACAAGASVQYYDLYELDFSGCRSCMACKKIGSANCKCYWKDDLSPVLDEIFSADSLIIGSPIYLGDLSCAFHAVLERMAFVTLSYNDYSCKYKGHLNVGVILTMNAPEVYYAQHYKNDIEKKLDYFRLFNGKLEITPVYDTLQVEDYSKYELGYWSEADKRMVHERRFPEDLKRAFEMGNKLSR
ncbi:MAG: flavodoxin family protein [Clostridiales bacterium]|jgi:multimeric flavodoxin WrbA|nr:flavodoxin family protein [Clostridiales bacterium]